MIRHFAAVSAVLAALLVEVMGVGAAAAHPRPVTAYDAHGHRLPHDPRLGNGEAVTLVVLGFAAHTSVSVADANRRTRRNVQADRHGSVRIGFTVPPRPATSRPDFIAFAGRPAGGYGSAPRRGNVVTAVPLLRRFVYRLASGHGIKGQHHGPGGGGLAGTGFDALALLIAAAAAIALGGLGLRAGRHRATR